MSDSRLGNLGALLANPTPRNPLASVTPLEKNPSGSSQQAPKPAQEPAEPAAKAKRVTVPRRPDATTATRSRVVVRMRASTHRDLVAKSQQAQLTFAGVILQAIEKTVTDGDLTRLVELAQTAPAPTGMFSTPATKTTGKAKVLVELSLTRSDLDTVDALVAEHGAHSRTQLILAALEAVL